MKRYVVLIILLFFIISAQVKIFAAESKDGWLSGIGIHAGIGTDIGLGLGLGVKASFFPLGVDNTPLEVGPEFFYSRTVDKSTEGGNDYTETTRLIIFGVLANYLFRYSYRENRTYFIVGAGFAVMSVDWEETSPDDISLGTPWGTGSMQSAETTTGGSVLNVGVGRSFRNGLDIRLETPVIIIFSPPGGATGISPTVTIMAGYRF